VESVMTPAWPAAFAGKVNVTVVTLPVVLKDARTPLPGW
jgi:hypothetical protein